MYFCDYIDSVDNNPDTNGISTLLTVLLGILLGLVIFVLVIIYQDGHQWTYLALAIALVISWLYGFYMVSAKYSLAHRDAKINKARVCVLWTSLCEELLENAAKNLNEADVHAQSIAGPVTALLKTVFLVLASDYGYEKMQEVVSRCSKIPVTVDFKAYSDEIDPERIRRKLVLIDKQDNVELGFLEIY